jgi:hypothetical protein
MEMKKRLSLQQYSSLEQRDGTLCHTHGSQLKNRQQQLGVDEEMGVPRTYQ